MTALTADVKKFCQKVISKYPLLKQELAALEEEREAIAGAVPSARWDEPVNARALGDRTANQAFKLLRLEEAWHRNHFYIAAIEDVLNFVGEEKRRMVQLRFWDGLPPWRVARDLNICERVLYKWQNELLLLLADRLGL